ncbi:uncharacterized protein LOC125654931 isoform X3 [Ostrea edulis]|uniref:uncharacterized protein LOC125654931 isoform X3 n=1 Tax=Ostrea edulis TaxID=37623 RepID=UPI0024AF59A4|nr:uncharacterized protein LOC125654931 isoform X3 [Ostrea edulis]
MADIDLEEDFVWQYRIPDFDSLSLGQISYNSDEMETPRQITMSQMHRKNHRVQKEFETWNKDIAKQVDHWMKDKPVQSGFLGSLSTQRAPLVSKSQSVKRKKLQKKRFRMKDNDDAMTSRDSESEFSLDSETFRSRRSRGRPPVSKSLSSSKDNANDTTSVFGSIHNEIEFKKRYRRMFDLNKHLQFVNSANGLMGKQILRKTHRLPPMTKELAKSPQKLECSELFAITTVQQSNDPSDFKTPSTQNVYHSLESTDLTDSGYDQTQLSSREVNTSSRKDLLDDDRHSNMSWRPNKTSKPEVFKFGKLPKISNNTIETNSSRDRLSTKDSVEMKSITTRLNDSLQKCASWVSETDSVNDEFSEVREMKVTINIKYKAEDRDKRKSKKSLVVMDDTSLNLTPFDKAKNMSKVNEQENFPGMLSE